MANTSLIALICCFVCFTHSYQPSNELNHWDISDQESNENLRYHTLVKRNSDDLDIKLKKTSISKKPIINIKSEITQKNVSVKQSNNKTATNREEEAVLPNMSVTYVDVEDIDNNGTNTVSAPNSTIQYENHTYYQSTFYSDPSQAMHFWVNISLFPKHQTVFHDMLSNSHRRAATVSLPFDFPFYGQSMNNITIATGGFLYVGDHVHSWLAATQYIAALMANFDTSLSNTSTIQYAYNETAFVIQWQDVMLHDKVDAMPNANFTFQIILLKSGDIIFVYKSVPFSIKNIPDTKHPVKVGISDAYIIDRTIFFIRRKTIYEYHRADLKDYAISNNTAIYFKALPTCASLQTCEECMNTKINFECGWCDSVNRCSDGYDRQRQEWIVKNCEASVKEGSISCLANSSTTVTPNMTHPSSTQTLIPGSDDKNIIEYQEHNEPNSAYVHREGESHSSSLSGSSAGLISVLIILAFFSGITLWVFYAYKNPQSSSGQLLIRYRPAQWRWGSSEARYTAASIHM